MRMRVSLRIGILFLIVVTPVFLRAQFQKPADEELKMTSDPMAPSAGAVYLDYVESEDNSMPRYTVYARIKVLTEKGKDLATADVPFVEEYYKIGAIQARTIHADGTVIPLTGKPEDFLLRSLSAPYGDLHIERKVFNMPSVEVGSILEYSYDVLPQYHMFGGGYFMQWESVPWWRIQRPYFVHRAHYEFKPFKQFQPGNVGESGPLPVHLVWWSELPPGVSVHPSASGSYTVDMTNIPPVPRVEWTPMDNYLYKVRVYYTYNTTSGDFWINAAKKWSKDVDHFAEPTVIIQDAVSKLIAPGDSELSKAKKLYAAV